MADQQPADPVRVIFETEGERSVKHDWGGWDGSQQFGIMLDERTPDAVRLWYNEHKPCAPGWQRSPRHESPHIHPNALPVLSVELLTWASGHHVQEPHTCPAGGVAAAA